MAMGSSVLSICAGSHPAGGNILHTEQDYNGLYAASRTSGPRREERERRTPIPTDTPLPHRTLLRDDVYRSIRDAIVRGQLAPGEQLRDQELGEWLQVSRTPVREALQRLAQAGLVVAQP